MVSRFLKLPTWVAMFTLAGARERSVEAGQQPNENANPSLARFDGDQWYAAPDGNAEGRGTKDHPWNLTTALQKVNVIKPGDVLWLRSGEYRYQVPSQNGFQMILRGTSEKPVLIKNYPGERAIIDATNCGAGFRVRGEYVWIWGLEFLTRNKKRVSAQSTSFPRDIPTTDLAYFESDPATGSGKGNKIIHCVFHDGTLGVAAWQGNPDVEFYGNLVYFNGWIAPDRPHGHGFYLQNDFPGYKLVRHNIVWGNASHGLQLYTSQGKIDNMTLDGNISFLNGERNLLYGGNAVPYKGVIINNRLFDFEDAGEKFNLGYRKNILESVCRSNYVAGGAVSFGGRALDDSLEIKDNEFYAPGGFKNIETADYPGNVWETALPTRGVRIFLFPSQYDPDRCHLAVYNWEQKEAVSVDLTETGWKSGDQVIFHNAQNFWEDQTKLTLDSENKVLISMTGHTVASPSGNFPERRSSFPAFGAFIAIRQH